MDAQEKQRFFDLVRDLREWLIRSDLEIVASDFRRSANYYERSKILGAHVARVREVDAFLSLHVETDR